MIFGGGAAKYHPLSFIAARHCEPKAKQSLCNPSLLGMTEGNDEAT